MSTIRVDLRRHFFEHRVGLLIGHLAGAGGLVAAAAVG